MNHRVRKWIAFGTGAVVFIVVLMAFLYVLNRAPISNINKALRECDRVTLRFIYGGVIDPPEPVPIYLTERQDIDNFREAMALNAAYTAIVPMARGSNPRIDALIERGGTKTAHIEVNGNLVLVLDQHGDVEYTIVLRSLKAYWHLLDVEEREMAK